MGNTTNKKKTTSVGTEEEKVVVVDKEKEELKNQLDELKKKFEELLNQQNNQVIKTVVEDKPKRNVKLISLTRGKLYLKGSRMHKFEKQFESRVFTEGEVRQIYANMPRTLSEGYVYIADSDMVDELELTDAYSYLINAETLKTLLKRNPNDVVEIYKNANNVQKNTIIGMVEDQKLLGKTLDANILIELGNLCGKDLMNIEPLTE